MRIDKRTTLLVPLDISSSVAYALKALNRELLRILGQAPVILHSQTTNQIRLQVASFPHEEMFRVQVFQDYVLIQGNNGLGLVYGIYHFCQTQLGIDPFEFWTDYPVENQEEIILPDYDYTALAPRVRFRGWFVNDEDCLIGWHDEMQISLNTWERIFETLLRSGYNMVIAGTGTKASDPQLELASQMGLWIAQHHAEPLGASLFSDVYPGVAPKFPEEKEKFIVLYRDAIARNKGRRVVWALGFRGQGDYPFFKDDERYDSPQKQGALISEMIALQKGLVEEMTDGPHYFVHYLYSESLDLYRAGHLHLDDDIVRIWSDNGFGAMRVRREWGPEKHITSLPLAKDPDQSLGVYYHLSFHDLQVSAKLVPHVSPELIAQQFDRIHQAGHLDLLLINVSNIRPHVFGIELVGKLISAIAETSNDPVSDSYHTYIRRHFPGFESRVQMLMERYYQAPFRFGMYRDEKVGEQVYHHTLRNCIKGVLKHESVVHLLQFIANAPPENEECFRWLLARAEESLPDWESLHQDTQTIHTGLSGQSARYFEDAIRMPIDYSYYSCLGFVSGLKGLLAYNRSEYREAFCLFDRAKKVMQQAWQALISCEYGKWIHFYRGEWLTDTRETIRQLETIRGMSKIMGDTDTWRSQWMMDALRLKNRSIHTLAQATTDYDRLADALRLCPGGDAIEDLNILR